MIAKTDSKQLKIDLKALPATIYEEVAALLASHGVENVTVNRIQVTPMAEAYDTEEECVQAGKIWKCDIIEGRDEPYCRCLNNT